MWTFPSKHRRMSFPFAYCAVKGKEKTIICNETIFSLRNVRYVRNVRVFARSANFAWHFVCFAYIKSGARLWKFVGSMRNFFYEIATEININVVKYFQGHYFIEIVWHLWNLIGNVWFPIRYAFNFRWFFEFLFHPFCVHIKFWSFLLWHF